MMILTDIIEEKDKGKVGRLMWDFHNAVWLATESFVSFQNVEV